MCPYAGKRSFEFQLLAIQNLPPEPQNVPDFREWLIQRSCQFYDHGMEAPHAEISPKRFTQLSQLPEQFATVVSAPIGPGVLVYLAWGATTFTMNRKLNDHYVLWNFQDEPRLSRLDLVSL